MIFSRESDANQLDDADQSTTNQGTACITNQRVLFSFADQMFSRIFRPPAPVARRISASYRSYASKKGPAPFGVAFDIDGVLLRGKIPVLGAVEALKLLNAHSVPYVFMTNGGGTLEKHKAESVAHALGVPVAVEQVILSHTPMKALAPKYK
jgi:hypothetical protein